MDENKTKRVFHSLDDLKEYLQEHPEMNGVPMQIDFEKSETSEDPATDAMHEELMQINEELDAIRKRHPGLMTFNVSFEFGKPSTDDAEKGNDISLDFCLSDDVTPDYNYQKFHEYFWDKVMENGGMPNFLKTLDYLVYDRVKTEIDSFRRKLAANLCNTAKNIKE